jgi:hypothetical protein
MLDAVSGALATREAPSATRYPDPSTAHLLSPKWLTARARGRSTERGSNARVAFLAVFGFGFWAVIFTVLFRLLRYFRGVQGIGPLVAGKLWGLILVGVFRSSCCRTSSAPRVFRARSRPARVGPWIGSSSTSRS